MIVGTAILRILEKAWPVMLVGLVMAAGYGLIEDSHNAHYERGRAEMKAERDFKRLTFEKELAVAAADEQRSQAEAAAAAAKAREAELQKLRRLYDQLRKKAAAVPDDGCLDRAVPDSADRLLRDSGAPGAAGDPDAGPGRP